MLAASLDWQRKRAMLNALFWLKCCHLQNVAQIYKEYICLQQVNHFDALKVTQG